MKPLKNRLFAAIVSVVLGIALTAGIGISAQQATPQATPEAEPEFKISLIDQQGAEVGNATLNQIDNLVDITVEVELGALELGEHGIHIHATGSCDLDSDPPFASAGDHFNPLGVVHGAPVLATPGATPAAQAAHAGDLGNIVVEEDAPALHAITTDRVTLEPGQDASLADEDGSALVIHADRDDLQTDPDGNSGERLICGVIFPVQQGGQTDTAITIEAVDIAFSPNRATIPAGVNVTVHLINTGNIDHTFNIDELNIDVYLEPGDEETITINAPVGEYQYYCAVAGHREGGQVGTLTVE